MATAVVNFTSFFAPLLHCIADEYIRALIDLFGNYIEEDSDDARIAASNFIVAIDNLLRSAANETSITAPLTEQLMEYVDEIGEDVNEVFAEEYIAIMRICALYAPELNESICSIPKKLYNYIEFDDALIEDVSPVVRIILQRFPSAANEETVTEPISEMLSLILTEEEIADNYWDGLVFIAQAVFIVCRESDFAQGLINSVLEMISEHESVTCGFATSLVICNPVSSLTLANVCEAWLECETPAAFLTAAIEVLSHWDEMPDTVKDIEVEIKEKIEECKRALSETVVPENIDPFAFPDPTDTDDWALYNKDAILANKILN